MYEIDVDSILGPYKRVGRMWASLWNAVMEIFIHS